MRVRLTAALLLGAAFVCAASAHAQTKRLDAIWARSTNGAAITLDGVLSEPAWAQAESTIIRYGRDNGIPGSGWQEEAGKLLRDSTYATVKFLVDGNYLYVAAVCRDSSIGGDLDFTRADGLLMQIKDHSVVDRPVPPKEYMVSWWLPADNSPATHEDSLRAWQVDGAPCIWGSWTYYNCDSARTAEQIDAWDVGYTVDGVVNQDTIPGSITMQVDKSYTMEMKFGLWQMGYDVTRAEGDIIEYGISVRDCDWHWDTYQRRLKRWGFNRTWWQSPWGNSSWYSEVRVHARPDVNVASGPVPDIPPEVRIANGALWPAPSIDGHLNEPVWSLAPSFDIRWNDTALRESYPSIGAWISGQWQPEVNANLADVTDPADATVRMFYRDTTLFIGVDVRDQWVQYVPLYTRYDGISVNLNARDSLYRDRNLEARWLTYIVGATGQGLALDYLPYLRDTKLGAQVALALKGGTAPDTIGFEPDSGYTIEMAVHLTKIGYPADLGDRAVFMGVNLMDGDSFGASSDLSYGTHQWWFWHDQRTCCPAWSYLDPALYVATDVPGAQGPERLALLGNFPNPFRSLTTIRYALAAASDVSLEVFDTQGRLVAKRGLGTQAAGAHHATFSNPGLRAGLYLYRLRAADVMSGENRASLTGKMLLVK
jgi:hypothetical protein